MLKKIRYQVILLILFFPLSLQAATFIDPHQWTWSDQVHYLTVKKISFNLYIRRVTLETTDGKKTFKIVFDDKDHDLGHIFGYQFIQHYHIQPGTKLRVTTKGVVEDVYEIEVLSKNGIKA